MKKYTKPEFTIASFEATDYISVSAQLIDKGGQSNEQLGHINFN